MSGGRWARARRQASFRGIPFIALENNLRRGRQVALHVYPFRDDAWPEDLGRSPPVTSLRGCVIGDDADRQIVRLIAAVEQAGPAQLVHPMLGQMTVQVLTFTCNDERERGRVWSFEISVTPAQARLYPAAALDTQGQVASLFGRVAQAVAGELEAARDAVAPYVQTALSVAETVQGYVAGAEDLVADATAIAHGVGGLGNFGRFAGGSGLSVPGLAPLSSGLVRVSGAIAGVQRAGQAVTDLAGRLP